MRKKGIYLAALALGIAVFSGSALDGMAADADGQGSARSVTETTYTDENGETKTIYWTDGITPPKMDPNGPDSEFERVEDKIGNNTYIDYIAPYVPGKGWYDVNKTLDQTHDANLCFSAAASNMLHWWFDQNSGYIDQYLRLYPDDPKAADIGELKVPPKGQLDSKIYARFVEQFADRQKGFWVDLLQDQFINGYTPKENGGVTDPDFEGADLIEKGPDRRGGFFYKVFGPNILTRRRYYDYVSSYGELSGNLREFIRQGDVVTLTYDMGASAHVVTLWGAEYDSKGNLCGVYYTDSDDDKTIDKGMHRYRVIDRKGTPYVTTDVRDDGLGSKVTCLTTLSTGKDTWERVTTQQKTEIGLVWGKTEFVYNGTAQKPELITWSIAEGDDAKLLAEGEGTEAGTYTASAKVTGTAADKYTLPADATKIFTIVPSGTVFSGGIKVYREQQETTIFDYGDTLTAEVSPRATGELPSASVTPLPQGFPTQGTMSLYCNNQLVAGPVSPDGNGLYTMTCIVDAGSFKTGNNTLTAKFHGDRNMVDYEETVRILISEDGYVSVAEVPPACETPGKMAHFIDREGKIYIEENGVKREVTEQELILPATGHRTGDWIQKENHHYHECLNGCGTILDEASCSGGTATVTEQAVCEVCGNPYGERLEKPVEPSEKYEIISGADSIYLVSPDGELTFRANGDFSKFTGIRIDGVVVDKRFYTAVSGSTIITLKAEYLNTLSEGSHTLEFEYVDGSVSCAFKVADALQVPPEVNPPETPPETDLPQVTPPETDVPGNELPQTEHLESPDEKQEDFSENTAEKAVKTGDDSTYRIWTGVLLLSGISLVFLWFRKKTKK